MHRRYKAFAGGWFTQGAKHGVQLLLLRWPLLSLVPFLSSQRVNPDGSRFVLSSWLLLSLLSFPQSSPASASFPLGHLHHLWQEGRKNQSLQPFRPQCSNSYPWQQQVKLPSMPENPCTGNSNNARSRHQLLKLWLSTSPEQSQQHSPHHPAGLVGINVQPLDTSVSTGLE